VDRQGAAGCVQHRARRCAPLRVYVPQLIDRTAVSSNADDLTVARHLGIHTLISGSSTSSHTLRVDAEIVDVATGVQKSSDSVRVTVDSFFQLQKTLVVSILRRLRVQLCAEEGSRSKPTPTPTSTRTVCFGNRR